MSYYHQERRKKFYQLRSQVKAATTVEQLREAMLEFMDDFEIHTHEVPGQMTEMGRNQGEDTTSPFGD